MRDRRLITSELSKSAALVKRFARIPFFSHISVRTLLLVFGCLVVVGWVRDAQAATGFSDVTSNGTAVNNSNGTWAASGAGATRLYTFTPNADNANLSTAEIVACLLGTNVNISGGVNPNGIPGGVTIVTTRAAGNQNGDITVSTAITPATTSTGNVFTLTLSANRNIAVNSAIDLTPTVGPNNGNGRPAYSVTLTAGAAGSVNISQAITTTASTGGGGNGGTGGAGGGISIIGPAGVTISQSLTANGGLGTGNGGGSNAGGNAGAISVTGVGITISAAISANGGDAGGGGGNANGGTGNSVSLNAQTGSLSLGASLSNIGGAPFGAGTTGAAGNYTFTLATASSQTAGTIAGGNVAKAGAGTLTLTGGNTYTGSTTINAGTLSVNTLANGGIASGIGQSTNVAGNLVLSGGTLQYCAASRIV
jgi:fibronectin-binding autotransporter adhesin